MALMFRPVSVLDLRRCIRICADPLVPLAEYAGTKPSSHLGKLLAKNMIFGAVAYDLENPEVILGFALNGCVTNDCIEELISGKLPCLLSAVLDPQMCDQVLLDLRQQERAHRSENEDSELNGVNMIGCFSGWSDENNNAIKSALADSVAMDTAGLNVKSFFKQVHRKDIADGFRDFFGIPIVDRPLVKLPRDYPVEAPIIVGKQRAQWKEENNPGQPINRIFDSRPPTLQEPLTKRQRQILQWCLLDSSLTNAQIAERLKLTPSYVLKELLKVSANVFGIVPTNSEENARSRDVEQRRKVIKYFRSHPEDLRPWVTLRTQIDLPCKK